MEYGGFMKKEIKLVIIIIVGLLIVGGVVAGIVLSLNNGKPSALNQAQTAAAKKQITTNWEKFFAGSTTIKERQQLLENGSKFGQLMEAEFKAIGSQSPSAIVSSVDVTNSTSANVYYEVELDKQPVLTGQKGQAVFQDGMWKVGDATLCGLLSMDGQHPAICKGQ